MPSSFSSSGDRAAGPVAPGHQWQRLRPDLLAGIAVAAIQVPTAIAYAELAGFPPQTGLYASVLPLVAYAIFGSSRQLIVGPDSATCAMVAATLLPLAGGDPTRSGLAGRIGADHIFPSVRSAADAYLAAAAARTVKVEGGAGDRARTGSAP